MITIDIETSIEFIKKQNLQSKSVHKGLATTKVVFLLSTAPPNMGFTKENDKFIIKTRVFSCAVKSARVHSIAPSAIDCTAIDLNPCARSQSVLQVPYGTALNDYARVFS
jgi:hypothetical protein